MAQTIFLICIALIFAVLGFNERRFLSDAQQHSATVITLFTFVRSNEEVSLTTLDKEISKKATVKLGGFTDNREGDTVLPEAVWENLKEGDTLKVWAFADLPRWVFWAPMIRYKKRDIWVKINFTVMTVVMGFALWSHIYYILS